MTDDKEKPKVTKKEPVFDAVSACDILGIASGDRLVIVKLFAGDMLTIPAWKRAIKGKI